MRDYSYSELENGIHEWVTGRNADRNRLILRCKLLKGMSYVEIANELNSDKYPDSYGIEVRQIQRIIRKYETIMFRHI